MKTIYLQIFLGFDIFLAGVLAATAFRHARAHYRPQEHDEPHPAGGHLPPAMREKLLEEAQSNFETVLNSATRDLQKDLQATSEEIKKHIEQISAQTREKELAHYKATIAEMQKGASEDMKSTDKQLAAQKAELKAKMAEEIEAEKKQLLDAIDTKLADAVASFLSETLGRDVDLGTQTAYLTKMLEEHKADFAKEVSGEA